MQQLMRPEKLFCFLSQQDYKPIAENMKGKHNGDNYDITVIM